MASSNNCGSEGKRPNDGIYLKFILSPLAQEPPALILKHGLVRLTVRETLICRILHGNRRTVTIVVAKFYAVIVPKIVFSQLRRLIDQCWRDRGFFLNRSGLVH